MPDIVLHHRSVHGAGGLARAACRAAMAAALLGIASPAGATWPSPTVNLPVCTMNGAQTFGSAISDGAGGMFLTWSDARFVVTDIYAQHIRSDGTLAWNPTGLVVCAASGRQDQPVIASDGAGGAIVAWRDFRTTVDGDIYAQRLDANGIATWLYNGIRICGATGPQSLPGILLDPFPHHGSPRGVYVVWQDERDIPRIYGQHVSATGVTDWADDGIPLTATFAAQFEPRLVDDGDAGAIVAWSQQSAAGYDIWAQHVDALGKQLWGPPGVQVCAAAGDQFGPVLAADGTDGAWIGWQDGRGPAQALYAQHVLPDGQALLASDGVPVCAYGADQVAPVIDSDGAGGLFAAWTDSRSGTEVYAERLDPYGVPLWAGGGVAVGSGSGVHQFASLAGDGTGGVIIGWEDSRAGSTDIYAQRLDPSGTATWTVGGAAISTAASNQYQVCVVSSRDSAAVLVWSDLRNGNLDLYAQRVPLSGGTLARQLSRRLSSSPNPAVETATFAFELQSPGRGELSVYDAAGRRVRTVAQADFSAGDHRVTWDARDDAGRRCAEGVYFARLELDGRVIATRTLALAR